MDNVNVGVNDCRLKLVKQLVNDLKKHPPNIEPPVSNLNVSIFRIL